MSKHTPGPWQPEGPDFFGDWNILHRADSLAIAAVVTNLREAAEVEANALLIAAAPDMLDALLSITWEHTNEAHQKACAIIAKATGIAT